MRIAVIQRDIRDLAAEPPAPEGSVTFTRDDLLPEGAEALGTLTVLEGDACFEPGEFEAAMTRMSSVIVLHPRSESELQAEAALELAIALSESVASLVLVVEDDGAEPGEPAHGGSAIVFAGEVLAEALSGADVLEADIEVPLARPLAHGAPVQVPIILQQRLASHRGRHLEVDYPADV